MTSKMLIDASHPEETRVVVMRGNRVDEFDFESANRKQLRGNIYLAKVTRVEPSLQAAFVEYGGNRHGFLAFSEIHPDYYQIPVADRQALLAAQERAEHEAEADAERRRNWRNRGRNARRNEESKRSEPVAAHPGVDEHAAADESGAAGDQPVEERLPEQEGGEIAAAPATTETSFETETHEAEAEGDQATEASTQSSPAEESSESETSRDDQAREHHASEDDQASAAESNQEQLNASESPDTAAANGENSDGGRDEQADEEAVESVGGADALEEVQERMPRVRARQYKIQEVIKRRQVMLVQVVKEERGTKGAALTTYLSLAGRYSVLMPNTSRGGGISRKITSSEDRSRLKEIAQELDVPEGMGVILRTAGASRTKAEVKRDFEYLLRIWEQVRDLTLKSTAPKLVYEEGSLIKRSIRDLYGKDIEEIVVSGEDGYSEAKEFMGMLMPSHANNVKLYRDSQPIFTRYGIESQLDAMFTPTVQLKSGGYIVINQAEALVAIDVNSGRATREHSIEDTAVKTNSEAAEEIARQLRLRDLAGLIVIDFIDMDERRNNHTVERRLKEALKHDRARIQVGRISHFGLLEMSRQRIRSSVLESSTEKCPICGGSGHVRSVSSVTLALLRAIEEMLLKGATHNLIVRTRAEVALYVLNQKRSHLRGLEERFRITITVSADPSVVGAQAFVIDRGEQVHSADAAREIAASASTTLPPLEQEAEDEITGHEEQDAEASGESEPQVGPGEDTRREASQRGRRRRRGGRGRGGNGREMREPAPSAPPASAESAEDRESAGETGEAIEGAFGAPPAGQSNLGESEDREGGRRRRRRGRRGGRRHRKNGESGYHGGRDDAEAQFQTEHGEPGYVPKPNPSAHQSDIAGESAPPSPAPMSAASEVPREPAPEPMQQIAETEPPRRGSTVREPASLTPTSSAPTSTPVVSSSGGEEQAPPKRGWWGRRLMGDKS